MELVKTNTAIHRRSKKTKMASGKLELHVANLPQMLETCFKMQIACFKRDTCAAQREICILADDRRLELRLPLISDSDGSTTKGLPEPEYMVLDLSFALLNGLQTAICILTVRVAAILI